MNPRERHQADRDAALSDYLRARDADPVHPEAMRRAVDAARLRVGRDDVTLAQVAEHLPALRSRLPAWIRLQAAERRLMEGR